MADLEAQLELLKVRISCVDDAFAHEIFLQATDHEPIAHTAIKTKLKKDRMLAANEHVQAAIKSELSSNLLVPAASGSSASKVESRLLSSKIIAAEVHSVVDTLKNVIQPEPKEALDEESDGEMEEEEDERPRKLSKGFKQAVDEDEESSVDDEEGQDGWESGSVHEPVDDGWESGSIQDGDEGIGGDGSEHSSDEEESLSEGSDNEYDTAQRTLPANLVKDVKNGTKAALPATDAKGKSRAVVGESTFLPTLSVGFTRGDSDASDWSDEEVDKVERKNRRGQRARRAYVLFSLSIHHLPAIVHEMG